MEDFQKIFISCLLAIIFCNAETIYSKRYFHFFVMFVIYLFKTFLLIGHYYLIFLNSFSLFVNIGSLILFHYFDFFWQIYLHFCIIFFFFSIPSFLILYWLDKISLEDKISLFNFKFFVLLVIFTYNPILSSLIMISIFFKKR